MGVKAFCFISLLRTHFYLSLNDRLNASLPNDRLSFAIISYANAATSFKTNSASHQMIHCASANSTHLYIISGG